VALQALDLPDFHEVHHAYTKGTAYLQAHFADLNFEQSGYIELASPIEALMLPGQEAWGVLDTIVRVPELVSYLRAKWPAFRAAGDINAASKILTLLHTQWKDLDNSTIRDITAWLLDVVKSNYSWPTHIGGIGDVHQTAKVVSSLRCFERISSYYVPLPTRAPWNPLGAQELQESSVSGVVIRRRQSSLEILLLKRKDETWVLPKGHIEPGEDPVTALRREIAEETNIRNVSVVKELPSFRYIFRPNEKSVSHKTVQYYVVEVLLREEPILKTDADHDDIRWFPLEQVHVVPLFYDDARQAISIATHWLHSR
jgi:8-oxo-dGTP pyrophosphatase MutT (NUDIX family)